MKKIILSVAVAAMALTTTASALEDIKVTGQTKLWYETNDKGDGLGYQDQASGEVVFKLGMTGKQGNVGFGATMYQGSTMGLETFMVSGARTNTTGATTTIVDTTDTNSSVSSTDVTSGGQPFFGEMYVTAPMGETTTLKFGKQELNTPLAFTEKWNAMPNTFNAAVAINKSIANLTLIGAYVGQDNATNFKADGEVTNAYTGEGSTIALGGLYKTDALSVNAWYYSLESVATAIWVDAGMKVAGMNIKGYFATVAPSADGVDATTGFAASVGTKVGGISLFGAFSSVGKDGEAAIANTSTGKKTKLPTAGVYTDGVYVAQPGSTAMKLKAVTKVGSTKLIAQFVNNTNTEVDSKETTEIDIIAIQKVW